MTVKPENVSIRLTLIDEVSPALRRISRRLWWMQYGGLVLGLLVTLAVIGAFVVGRLSA